MPTIHELTELHEAGKKTNPDALKLRIHRALSWLRQADNVDTIDSKFIFYWISFNVIYAQDFEEGARGADKGLFFQFIYRLCVLDKDKSIGNHPLN